MQINSLRFNVTHTCRIAARTRSNYVVDVIRSGACGVDVGSLDDTRTLWRCASGGNICRYLMQRSYPKNEQDDHIINI